MGWVAVNNNAFLIAPGRRKSVEINSLDTAGKVRERESELRRTFAVLTVGKVPHSLNKRLNTFPVVAVQKT